jgi:hypothetical protein
MKGGVRGITLETRAEDLYLLWLREGREEGGTFLLGIPVVVGTMEDM